MRSLLGVLVMGGVVMTVLLYLLPVVIAWARNAPDIGVVAVINVLLGWTFIGWVVALALALRPVPRSGPVVQVTQYLPAPPPRPGPAPDADWAGPAGPPYRPDAPPPLALPSRPAWPDNPAHGSAGYDPLDEAGRGG